MSDRTIVRLAIVVYFIGIPPSFGYLWNMSPEKIRKFGPELPIFGAILWPVSAPCVWCAVHMSADAHKEGAPNV